MKTFVAEDVLTDYTPGLIVVKAKNKKEAIELVLKEVCFDPICDEDGIDYDNKLCLSNKLRELKDNEVVYVVGGA